jgi:hypothetical protein
LNYWLVCTKNPTAEFYSENKDAFKEFVETPFQNLMRSVVDKLNPEIVDFMETERGFFQGFLRMIMVEVELGIITGDDSTQRVPINQMARN